ncbi:hypothetical protein ACFY71_29780 [Streptomyces cinerochromogenes]|uniref:hypothetical protein n=1 Tax=Streptomyces cinerochromogenes TaxID=66422 RepID=UPI003673968C
MGATVLSETGAQSVREAARRIVDLVLTEDDVYLDSLPEEVEVSIGVPLTEAARMLDEPVGDKEFRGGLRLLAGRSLDRTGPHIFQRGTPAPARSTT